MDIKLENIDSELMIKSFRIRANKKEIKTPEKASYSTNSISGINEIYKKFSINSPRTASLEKILKSENYETKINSRIKSEVRNNLNLFIVDYCDDNIPNQKHLEALSDTQYVYSDVVVTPIFSSFFRNDELLGDNLIDTFIELTNKYIEVVETLNNKDIMGVIPIRAPRNYYDKIFDNYYDKDITSFIIDFDGKSSDTNLPKIRKLFRLLKDHDLLESSILYGLNVSEGKFMKDATEIPARDFISLGFGFDIIGLNHVPPRMPTASWKEITAKRRTYRLFNKNNYGYAKVSEDDIFSKGIFGKTDVVKHNNTEQFKETTKIKEFMAKGPTIEPYLSSKSHVTEKTIDKIRKLRNDTFK